MAKVKGNKQQEVEVKKPVQPIEQKVSIPTEQPKDNAPVLSKAEKAKNFLKSMANKKGAAKTFETIKNCVVRFDVGQAQWAILKQEGDAFVPDRHFPFGVLKNVQLVARSESTSIYTCGGTRTSTAWAGIAKAETLELLTHGSGDLAGFQNLRFDKDRGSFLTSKGKVVTEAQEIRLLPNRSAMYR